MANKKTPANITDKGLARKPSGESAPIPKAVCDGVLPIGGMEIPCSVLDGGVRVLSERSTLKGMGITQRSQSGPSLPRFLRYDNLKPFIGADLIADLQPIQYSSRGKVAYGVKAEMLPMICDVYLQALAKRALKDNQIRIAERCRILQKGFATVGIVALIDEATGYQDERAKNALAKILEQFLEDEAHKWTRTFPLAFYRHIYRLKGWDWQELESGKKPRTPQLVGQYTDNLVYKRIAPGVLEELKRRKKDLEQKQKPAVRQHQWFSENRGHPKLKEHIAGVMAIMRLSSGWDYFMNNLEKAYPLRTKQGHFFARPSADDGE